MIFFTDRWPIRLLAPAILEDLSEISTDLGQIETLFSEIIKLRRDLADQASEFKLAIYYD